MKIITLMLATLLCLPACANLDLADSDTQVLAKIIARRVGHRLAIQDPDLALRAKTVAETLESGNLMPLDYFRALLAENTGDPLLASDIEMLLGSLHFDSPEIEVECLPAIQIIAEWFVAGVEMGEQGAGSGGHGAGSREQGAGSN